jgi:cytochrome P450
MAFLPTYEALSADDARKALLMQWINTRRQELFQELRAYAPILETQEFVLLSRHDDVKEVLRNVEDFSATAYITSDQFVLGKDPETGHDQDRESLISIIPRSDLEWVRHIAATATTKLLTLIKGEGERKTHLPGRSAPRPAAGRINLPIDFARTISLEVVHSYFGISEPDPTHFGVSPLLFKLARPVPPELQGLVNPRQVMAQIDPNFPSVGNWLAAITAAFHLTTFGRHFLPDFAAALPILARAQAAGEMFGKHLHEIITNSFDTPPQGLATVLQRLVAAEVAAAQVANPQRSLTELLPNTLPSVIRNIIGLVAGMIDNVNAAVCNAVDTLLSHPTTLAEATAIARAMIPADQAGATSPENMGRRTQLWAYIREALRLNEPAPFLPRIAKKNLILAPGTPRATPITKGRAILVAICSAMLDEQVIKNPLELRSDRNLPSEDDLLFGSGWHDCFGKYISEVQIVEMMRGLLTLDNLRRAPGPSGTLVYKETFPQQLAVDFGPQHIQTALTAIMEIKPPTARHARALKLLLTHAYQRVVDILDQVGTVHFARFIFLENDTKLALITSYDGSFETYMKNYIEVAGDLFDFMLDHIKDAPPLPVRQYRNEFIEYVRRIDVVSDSPLYSAYGDLTVQDILPLQKRENV